MLFIDMDGVLSDFSGHVKNLLGFYPHENEDLMQREVPKIPDFWDTMPMLPDALDLWEHVKQYNPYILTASASWDREASERAKPIWLMKHLPGLNPDRIRVVRRSQKADYAVRINEAEDKTHPCVLVDDYNKNAMEWSKAGGVPVLHVSALTTIRTLELPHVKRHFHF